jgi:hypothetical protein
MPPVFVQYYKPKQGMESAAIRQDWRIVLTSGAAAIYKPLLRFKTSKLFTFGTEVLSFGVGPPKRSF